MRRVLITGGVGGLGRTLAAEVVARGDAAVIVARDRARGEAVIQALRGPGEARLVVGELATIAGVRALARAIEAGPAIDVLVHNAVIWPGRRQLTADGIERAFQVNHLAPFLLNALLEGRLRARGARVIQVSAGVYPLGRVDRARTPTGGDFSALRTHANTALCNLLTTRLWAARWADRPAIDAICPGVLRGLGERRDPAAWLLRQLQRRGPAAIDGARAVLRLIDDRGHGRLFAGDAEVGFADPAGAGPLARDLWIDATARCGVDLPPPAMAAWAARAAAGAVQPSGR